ncbi:MAG: alpha-hydroxy acid oxidase [Burkholderiales bacterium]
MNPPAAVPARLRDILSLDDFEAAARRHLPRPLFAYVSGGVEDNFSREDNRAAFREWSFVPRVLAGVSGRSQQTALLGREYAHPFGIAPIGIAALYAWRGDLAMANAARSANIPMAMSGSSLIRLEEVAKAAPDAWFQAYLPGDEKTITELLARVAAAGFGTLVLTVDVPTAGNRENNVRAGFSTPLRPTPRLAWDGITHPRWLFGTFLATLVRHGMPHFENNFATRGAPILSPDVLRDFSDRGNLDWGHYDLIRRLWKGRLVVKGILDPDDARRAIDRGADAIVVSNHGGRQLDGAIAPLRVLAEVAQACGEVPVIFDSGVRRGTDVLKALALGAKFVLLGRSFGYAAAVGGEAGVAHAVRILAAEIDRDMAMLGIRRLSELRPSHLRRTRD